MLKRLLKLSLLATVWSCGSLFSFETSDFLKNSSFTLGPEYAYVNLHNKATSVAPGTKFKGPCWGGTGAYEYKQANGIYVNVNGYFIGGPFRGNHEHRYLTDMRFEFRLGHVFVLDCEQKWKLTPYAGFGWGKIRQSHGNPSTPGGKHVTTRTPTYYIPIGFNLSYSFCENFIVGTNVKYTPQVDATFKTSTIPHGKWILHNRDGWVIELPVTYHQKWCNVDYSISLAPYWRLLNKGTGTSRTTACVDRPVAAQRYNFYGLKLLFGAAF